MKIALAQAPSVPGDIEANIALHLRFCAAAKARGAGAIFFPELSLTGYVPSLARKLQITADDSRLNVFEKFAKEQQMHICVGAPIVGDEKPQIAALTFNRYTEQHLKTKYFLHKSEEAYFEAGNKGGEIAAGLLIFPTICYESMVPSMMNYAVAIGIDVYIGCMAKDEAGMEKAIAYFSEKAKEVKLSIGIVNAVGAAEGFSCSGGSRGWSNSPEYIEFDVLTEADL
jgi:predicted amidohydrolase